jgi:hypothetical protein
MQHFVTVVTITDRCDFDRVLLRRAFLGRSMRARAWGEERCEALLQAKPAAERDLFDPHADVQIVELA